VIEKVSRYDAEASANGHYCFSPLRQQRLSANSSDKGQSHTSQEEYEQPRAPMDAISSPKRESAEQPDDHDEAAMRQVVSGQQAHHLRRKSQQQRKGKTMHHAKNGHAHAQHVEIGTKCGNCLHASYSPSAALVRIL
jgi:hypothetical protein